MTIESSVKQYSTLTLPTPEENLACDEALLDCAEEGDLGEVLRFWAPSQHFVVVGYANRVAREVNLAFCERHQVPILRRCSGGGTVLQGPGCLNYSLILRMEEGGPFNGITSTNQFILARHESALRALLNAPVEIQGHTDLAIGGLKFSGNSQRRKRRFLLFHGSFLLNVDIELIESALPFPSLAPEYRRRRSHKDFLRNLEIAPRALQRALADAWGASERLGSIPYSRVEALVAEKYGKRDWNFKF
jgi:lipoate---protein ligase